MKKQIFTLLSLAAVGTASAQVYIADKALTLYSVTNDGLAVGAGTQNSPFTVWDPIHDTYTEIGGVAAGNGVGGNAKFSDDGKFVVATAYSENIPLSQAWKSSTYSKYNYIFSDYGVMNYSKTYLVASSEDGQKGYILSGGGIQWTSNMFVGADGLSQTCSDGGLLCIAPISAYVALAGGYNGQLYQAKGNGMWYYVDIHPEGNTDEVDTYTAMDFIVSNDYYNPTKYGCVGLKLKDGSAAVWFTEDCETFQVSEGVEGIPTYITHVDEVYYMTTENGYIQASLDFGKTWSEVFSTEDGSPLYRIRFADGDKGIALSDNVVYITNDGGDTWNKTNVLPAVNPFATTVKWKDAIYHEDEIVMVANGVAYRSTDNGGSFTEFVIDDTAKRDYATIFYDEDSNSYMVAADGGYFYKKGIKSSTSGYGTSFYDVANDTWTQAATLTDEDYGVFSAPYDFSGDGSTAVGLAYVYSEETNSVQGHAAAWVGTDKVIDLGSKFDYMNRASRANAVNYDGSVIVGWQDIFGPWYASVWRRNADGTYKQTLMVAEPGKTEKNVDFSDQNDCRAKLPGYCQCVSPDGKWIGGWGNIYQTALSGAWIWNEEDGFKVIEEDEEVSGTTSYINNDGDFAFGFRDFGPHWIWTKEHGQMDSHEYATEVLGYDLGDYLFLYVTAISPNGRYLAGGVSFEGDNYSCILDLEGNTSAVDNKALSQVKASVYPNPVADELHVALPFNADELATTLTLVDMQGRMVRKVNNASQDNVINVSDLTTGIYVLDVNAAGTHKSFKVVVKH